MRKGVIAPLKGSLKKAKPCACAEAQVGAGRCCRLVPSTGTFTRCWAKQTVTHMFFAVRNNKSSFRVRSWKCRWAKRKGETAAKFTSSIVSQNIILAAKSYNWSQKTSMMSINSKIERTGGHNGFKESFFTWELSLVQENPNTAAVAAHKNWKNALAASLLQVTMKIWLRNILSHIRLA